MSSQKVVFWDIDGTLVSGSLERSFISYLRKNKLVRNSTIVLSFLRLVLRLPLPKWYQLKLCYLQGATLADTNSQAESCWRDELEAKLFPGAQEAIAHFSSANIKQVILSGTIMPLANQLAKRLKIDEVIAAEPECVDGRYSGRTSRAHPHGVVKVTRAEEWLDEHGFDWSKTIAIANHFDDRFLLEKCGLPVAAHPDDKLRAYANERGWMIVDDLLELTNMKLQT